jgi:hypothetical protein
MRDGCGTTLGKSGSLLRWLSVVVLLLICTDGVFPESYSVSGDGAPDGSSVAATLSYKIDLHPITGQFRELKSPLWERFESAASASRIRSVFAA